MVIHRSVSCKKKISLSDKYEKRKVKFSSLAYKHLLGFLNTKDLDAQNNLNTGGFISGYKGSPLGGYDLELSKRKNI